MEPVDHALLLSNMGLLALTLMLMAFLSSRVSAAACPADTRPAVWWTVSAWKPAPATGLAQTTG